MELKAVAVAPALHGRGGGQLMMKMVLFRFWKIERDFFSPERGHAEGTRENEFSCATLVWMDQAL